MLWSVDLDRAERLLLLPKLCGCDRTVMCFVANEDYVGSTPTIRSKIEYAGLMFNSSMTGFQPVRKGAIPLTRSIMGCKL